MALLLAKGDNLAEWRGVEEFIASYREAAIKLASVRHPEGIAQMLEVMEGQLESVVFENQTFAELVAQMSANLQEAQQQDGSRDLLLRFFEQAYRHYRRFGSVPAFFDAANEMLRSLAIMQVACARRDALVDLPPLALMVLGPAGRLEWTQFCRIQLVLVWDGDGSAAQDQVMADLGAELVAGFRACGVPIDEAITPLHAAWRGSLAQWGERIEYGIARGTTSDMIELLRLVDQSVLVNTDGLAERFQSLCSSQLQRRHAVVNMLSRCLALSNGIGMMGGLKLERSGPHRGKFNLLDHALVPLAACVAGLCLHHEIFEDGTPRRLRELVRNGRIDVDLAERALTAWYLFSEHRLNLELDATIGEDCRDILHLDLGSLSDNQQALLKESLEAVGNVQRNLQVIFGQLA